MKLSLLGWSLIATGVLIAMAYGWVGFGDSIASNSEGYLDQWQWGDYGRALASFTKVSLVGLSASIVLAVAFCREEAK